MSSPPLRNSNTTSPPPPPPAASSSAAAAADEDPLPAEDVVLDDEDDNNNERAEIPLTMAASVMFDQLPRDAHAALEHAGEVGVAKITVRLSALPATPQLRQPRFKISSTQRFEAVVRFLRRKLQLKDHEAVFCYVNSCFAPGLDEGVGNLWRCFKINDELVVGYSVTQAFG